MIPFILAAIGGYLIGDSIGDDIDSKIPKFADGGVTPIRYKDMTKADWEEFYIESKKEADNKTFHEYYDKYKLLTQPHIAYSLEKSNNFKDFYTRLNHYGYHGIDGKIPMMADGGMAKSGELGDKKYQYYILETKDGKVDFVVKRTIATLDEIIKNAKKYSINIFASNFGTWESKRGGGHYTMEIVNEDGSDFENDKEYDKISKTLGVVKKVKYAKGGMMADVNKLPKGVYDYETYQFKGGTSYPTKQWLISLWKWSILQNHLEDKTDIKDANDWRVALQTEDDGKTSIGRKSPYSARYMYSPSLDKLREQTESEWYTYGSNSDFFADGGTIKDFCEEWGQSHEEICANLGYDEESADDLLVVDYFFYFKEDCWLPISSSFYTAEEQELANELRLKTDD